MGSELGISTEKLNALHNYARSPLFNAAERSELLAQELGKVFAGNHPRSLVLARFASQAGFQSSAEGTRSARLKRELAFSHAINIVSSAICSSS